MITSTSAFGSIPTSAQSDPAQRTVLGQDAFLKLLVTQLRNQDPLNPLQPHEFAAQLAQFSSVEQLTHLNDAVAAQSANQQLATLIDQTALSTAMIGRTVIAEGSQIGIPADGAVVDVGGTGGSATLRLLDAGGREVASRALGTIAGGRQTLALPSDLPAGTYTYELAVTDAQGGSVPVTRYVTGTVDSVSFTSNGIVLRVGGIDVPLEAVAELTAARTTTTTPDQNGHDDPAPPIGGRGRIDVR